MPKYKYMSQIFEDYRSMVDFCRKYTLPESGDLFWFYKKYIRHNVDIKNIPSDKLREFDKLKLQCISYGWQKIIGN
ncbi:MAG TPA: hypothetical protein PKJ33_01955 [Alphaproteobacteria bacterium]|nr:hypothetical protein [Alphaproteobacteria bacterium]